MLGRSDKVNELLDLLAQLNNRRVYGPVGNWTHVPLNTSDINEIRKIIRLTTGRLMVGMASVTLEDERDVVALKIAISV